MSLVTQKYIYERNSDTGEIFRRKKGDYDSPRECINPEINSVPNINIENMSQMMSLYDYLGRAAGPDLGQRVANAAVTQKIKIKTFNDLIIQPINSRVKTLSNPLKI